MRSQLAAVVLGIPALALIGVIAVLLMEESKSPTMRRSRTDSAAVQQQRQPRLLNFGDLLLWWDQPTPDVEATTVVMASASNIHPNDYRGPESCQKCHQENYSHWYDHPHRLMNAVATPETVVGDFSGDASIEYLGGKATFVERDGTWLMELLRGDSRLTYEIRQTIGSRFFQYYIGRLRDGSFPSDHRYRTVDHVLPFGYWLDREEWVPVVHISHELPDGKRVDPFAPPQDPKMGEEFAPYAVMCNLCHTTFPLGDSLIRKPNVVGVDPPHRMHFDLARYTQHAHPEILSPTINPINADDSQVQATLAQYTMMTAPEHAATLGISCEACHLGCDEHVRDPQEKPHFLPHSEYLRIEAKPDEIDTSRNVENINWICSRCHAGQRPELAAGMSTWNSTEYTDAAKGACYSQLKCTDCHDPHAGIGKTWPKTAAEDDATCIRCHEQYGTEEGIVAHTHHPVGTEGARCLNCHMPRLNEGLQNVVRTHMIFSPTHPGMLEKNHPNACNICHTDQNIDWTLSHLKEWYGAEFSEEAIRRNYSNRKSSVAAGWLKSKNEAVRLIATDAVARSGNEQLVKPLIEVLDDDYLLNRQFARIALESMLEIRLEDHGYRFYMTPGERAAPIQSIKAALLEKQ